MAARYFLQRSPRSKTFFSLVQAKSIQRSGERAGWKLYQDYQQSKQLAMKARPEVNGAANESYYLLSALKVPLSTKNTAGEVQALDLIATRTLRTWNLIWRNVVPRTRVEV